MHRNEVQKVWTTASREHGLVPKGRLVVTNKLGSWPYEPNGSGSAPLPTPSSVRYSS
jgi:hypothetical protein